MTPGLVVLLILAVVVLIVIAKTAVVVPQQNAYVVERLGRYSGTLGAGFHVLLPFVDVIRYRHSLKEGAYDIPAQVCITRDNVQVGVDGVLYLKVLNAERASYGIADYLFAITQLAQTTLRSEIGKIDLDKTFEERTNINLSVVTELDKASEPWGVKVLRYEIKNITPPHDILAAMEKQMRAEREKRAVILTSEGSRDAVINAAQPLCGGRRHCKDGRSLTFGFVDLLLLARFRRLDRFLLGALRRVDDGVARAFGGQDHRALLALGVQHLEIEHADHSDLDVVARDAHLCGDVVSSLLQREAIADHVHERQEHVESCAESP